MPESNQVCLAGMFKGHHCNASPNITFEQVPISEHEGETLSFRNVTVVPDKLKSGS